MTQQVRVRSWIPGPAGSVTAAQFAAIATDYPVVKAASLSTPSPDLSTADTAVYAVALETTIDVGLGTWTISGMGSVNLRHSASGDVDGRLDINGDNGAAVSGAVGATTSDRSRFMFTHTLTGVAGPASIPLRVEFKSGGASPGTTTANNPALFAMAIRE